MDGFELLVVGKGGDVLIVEVCKFERFVWFDDEIVGMGVFQELMGFFWVGFQMDIVVFVDVIVFMEVFLSLCMFGVLFVVFDYVVRGVCGKVLVKDYVLLKECEVVEVKLVDLNYLGMLCFGVWKGFEINFEEFIKVVFFQWLIVVVVVNLVIGLEDVGEVCQVFEKFVIDGNVLLDVIGLVVLVGREYLDVFGRFQLFIDCLVSFGLFDMYSLECYNDIDVKDLKCRCEWIIVLEYKFNVWCVWCKVSFQVMVLGLSFIVVGLINGVVVLVDVCWVFEINYCRWWLNVVVDSEFVI